MPAALEGLLITIRAGWLDSQFLDFQNEVFERQPDGAGIIKRTTDFSGNPLPNSPEFQVSGGVELAQPRALRLVQRAGHEASSSAVASSARRSQVRANR